MLEIIKGACCAATVVITTAFAGPSVAATIDITTSTGQLQMMKHGIRDDSSTRGADLNGMTVRATYADGTSENLTWKALDEFTNGATTGNKINMAMGWRNFDMTTTKRLASLVFDVSPANTLFDMSRLRPGADGNTYGTKRGYPFRLYSGGDGLVGNIVARYSNAVKLARHPLGVDAFTMMAVDFTGLENGGFLGNLGFQTDMDTLQVAGDLTPVPLPAGGLLLLTALGGLGLARHRRKGAKAA